jgi:SEC-C motif domain protein
MAYILSTLVFFRFLAVLFALKQYNTYKISQKPHKSALYAGFGKSTKSSAPAIDIDKACNCGSGIQYRSCCKILHDGNLSGKSPEAIVRSRFTAFSLGLLDYITKTTHPENIEYVSADKTSKRKTWERSIRQYMDENTFKELDFIGTNNDDPDEPTVKFVVKYERKSDNKLFGLEETSIFKKEADAWLYLHGDGPRPVLIT